MDGAEQKLHELAGQIAVLTFQLGVQDRRLVEAIEEIAELKRETEGLNRIANRALGLFFGLTLIGGAIGTFWDKVVKLWQH